MRLVRGAGGVPVMAHPLAARRGRVVPDAVIAALAAAGLAGLEVDHRDHDPAEREHLRGLAAALGLLTTGASDYHGTGKLNRLGENLTDPPRCWSGSRRGDREPGGPAVSAVLNGQLFLNCFVTLFVIMDPPGTLPVFLALTANAERAERIRAARQAVAVALLVIVLFAIFGQGILDYLHVSLPALQGAGGLLLLLVALSLLTDRADSEPVRTEGVNIAFVPLGTPLLAGPGAIVATMVFAGRIHSFADVVGRRLGRPGRARRPVPRDALRRRHPAPARPQRGVSLVTRIAGLLLSAIAVQLVADSVRAFVEGQG